MPKEDPSCPSRMRRAKHIARSILSKVNSVSVGEDDEAYISVKYGDASVIEESSSGGDINKGRKCDYPGGGYGPRKNKRPAGVCGMCTEKYVDPLVQHFV